MIPANCDRAYLEEIYDLKFSQAKTLRTVDDKPQWVVCLLMSAMCMGKILTATKEFLADKVTPELIAEYEAKYVDSLKLEILRRECASERHS